MLYVNNIAYTCRNIDSSKRGTAPLKGGLDIWKCTLHSFKGHGATFQGILHILFGYCPCKKTPKEGCSYSEGNVCFEYYYIMQKLCFVEGTL
jgi:hypothetical protein